MANEDTLLALQSHINRTQRHAGAFATKVASLYKEYHPPFDPNIGWDNGFIPLAKRRDGQAYVPVPVVYVTVEIMGNLMGLRVPRITMDPKSSKEADRASAARTELLSKFEFQKQNMAEVHLNLSKNLALKGRAGVKLGYEGKELWTDHIDLIENLWTDFMDDSYTRPRSYTFHSIITRDRAKELGWQGDQIENKSFFSEFVSKFFPSDHSDPLGISLQARSHSPQIQKFEGIPMIDFHYRKDGAIYNAIYIANELVKDEKTKFDDFPYITANANTEPGNPYGVGDAEPVVFLQKEISTRATAWAEAIRRNGSDTWVTHNVRNFKPTDISGMKVFSLGDPDVEKILPLKYPIDNVGYKEYLQECWETYRKVTGIPPEVLGGGTINAATSGYAMAVRFQSVVNRLGGRERRLKSFYQMWNYKTLKNMEIVDPSSKDVIEGNYFTTVDFDSPTPRDFTQTVATLANAVNSNIMSHRTAMEQLGLVSEDEEQYIREFNEDPGLSPDKAAAITAYLGQMAAIRGGSAAAAQQQAWAQQAQAQPSQLGENQHTAAPQRIPAQQTASQLVGASQPVGSPVTVSPPGL